MSDFENTPLVINNNATTYGEMRENAKQTRAETNVLSVAMAAQKDPRLLAAAIRGLCEVVLYLVDEIEQLSASQQDQEAS